MTAEIIVMNREAIAMAADSAVTMRTENGHKIFTSANKIFALSKYQSVGVMVFGSANFMGIPWETIIKVYRRQLKQKTFASLKEYAENLLRFLSRDSRLSPQKQQQHHVRVCVHGFYLFIKHEILKEVEKKLGNNAPVSDVETTKIATDVIRHFYDRIERAPYAPKTSRRNSTGLLRKYGAIFAESRLAIFEKLPLTAITSNQLRKIAANLFLKNISGYSNSSETGIVIAGFGERDLFPGYISYRLHGIANNHLRYRQEAVNQTGYSRSSSIMPFAQDDVVRTFIEGIAPSYKHQISAIVEQILSQLPGIFVDGIPKLTSREKTRLKAKLAKAMKQVVEKSNKELKDFSTTRFINPITTVVSMLPKNELAEMAETLVNLTSFKRRVSTGMETVGGPIDVAVISKGDGLVWIKRKHYFKPELNQQFFANYYR